MVHLVGVRRSLFDGPLVLLGTDTSPPLSRSIFFNTRMTRAEFQSKVAKRFEDGEVPPSVVNGPNELAAPPTSKRNGIALKEKVN